MGILAIEIALENLGRLALYISQLDPTQLGEHQHAAADYLSLRGHYYCYYCHPILLDIVYVCIKRSLPGVLAGTSQVWCSIEI